MNWNCKKYRGIKDYKSMSEERLLSSLKWKKVKRILMMPEYKIWKNILMN